MADQADNIVVPVEATPADVAPAVATEKRATESAEPVDTDPLSQKVTLADICAKGTSLYSQKNYEGAAEQFGRAAELQAELNGEMNPDNADILFLYGRSVFRLGQAKSDVLGGKAPEKRPEAPKKEEKSSGVIGNSIAAAKQGGPSDSVEKEAQAKLQEKKPLFQFTGDENFEEEDEEEEEGGEGEQEEDDDDLAVAFEVLDLSRLLFGKKLDQLVAQGADKHEVETPTLRHVKERLADVHDLLGEISLENERYANAITDARESLKYKEQLYPEESEILAEAHFKLSLALEFASITTAAGEDGEESAPQQIDQGLRDEAVEELEAALKSTKLKLAAKERELAELASPEENEASRAQIADVQEIIADMEQRLVDLRGPPIDLDTALAANPLGGVLGSIAGASKAEAEALLDEAKKGARDLSGLVKKKEKAVAEAAKAAAQAVIPEVPPPVTGKRKAERLEVEDGVEEKRARTEEPVEDGVEEK